MAMIPLLVARLIAEIGGEDEMSDLQFLSIKEFEDKRVDINSIYNNTNSTAENDIAIQTATTGKDMYLAEASVSFRLNSVTGKSVIFRLRVNDVEIEKFTRTPNPQDNILRIFLQTGLKVLTGETIRITAQNNNTTNGVLGVAILKLWEEDTGATPQIPPLTPV